LSKNDEKIIIYFVMRYIYIPNFMTLALLYQTLQGEVKYKRCGIYVKHKIFIINLLFYS